MTNKTKTASIRHAELKIEADAQIKRITNAVFGHRQGLGTDWADVGDLAHLVDLLAIAANFINGNRAVKELSAVLGGSKHGPCAGEHSSDEG